MSKPGRPSTEVYSEPYTWDTTTDWTPSLFEQSLQEADQGMMQSAADLCDAMLADDRIGAVLNTRFNALFGCEVEFEADSARARKAIEKDWYRFANEADLKLHCMWACFLGVSIANTPFVEVDGRWVQKVRVWHMRNANYDFIRGAWYVTDSRGRRIDIKENDPEWWVLTPYGANRPWSRGTWRQSALYWLGKSTSWRDWQRHNEVHGSTIIAGTLPEGTPITDPGVQAFWTQLKAIGKRARIVMPHGYGLETIEAQASTWQTFPEAIKTANTAIAIVHLGQNLTTEVDGGSYAATVAHGTVRHDYLRADAQSLATAVHDWPLSHWQRFNFGKGEPPWVTWKTDPPEDLKQIADTLNAAGDALSKWTAAGVNVDREAYAEKFGLELDKSEPVSDPEPEPGAEDPMPPEGNSDEAGEPDLELHDKVTLASGDTEEVEGFRAGQAYADKLAAASRDAGAAALSPELDAIMAIVEHLDDTPEWPIQLKQKLLDRYGSLGAEKFADVVEKSMILAELAGRYAVRVDAEPDVADLTDRIIELAREDGNEAEIVALAKKAAARVYQRGPKGGTYYVSPSGKKVYGKPRPGLDTVKGAPSDGASKTAPTAPKGGGGPGTGDAPKAEAKPPKTPVSEDAVARVKELLKQAPTEKMDKFAKKETALPVDYESKIAPTAAQGKALSDWSGDRYQAIRASYHKEGDAYVEHAKKIGKYPPSKADKKSAKDLDDFLKSAPKVEGEVYRGSSIKNSELVKLVDSGQFSMSGPTSTSRSADAAIGFAFMGSANKSGDVPVIFALKSKSGVDISSQSGFPPEKEVLLPHGAKFNVTGLKKIRRKDGSFIVVVEGQET